MKKLATLSALLFVLLAVIFGCDKITEPPKTGYENITSIEIQGEEEVYLTKGYTLQLTTNAPKELQSELTWATAGDVISLTNYGFVTAKNEGTATVTVFWGDFRDTVTIVVVSETDIVPSETQPSEPQPDETNPVETQPAETQPVETQPDGTKPVETQPDGTKPVETQPAETQPVETQPNETKPAETKPVETEPSVTEPETEPETEYIPPTVIIEAERSPQGYKPAGSYQEALDRTQNGQLSGYPYVPDQAPNISEYRPMEDGKYIKNTDPYYIDENTYVVVDAYGREVFRVYRGGAYITLEEVAAYVWAFGDIPANHSASKKTSPASSIWGEYLRVNHTQFSGNTSKYPYEPELPRISGCGGDFTYYEMDIGTTGTDCDPSYSAVLYNNGTRITRGAARIVYARFDRNGNKIIDPDEKYVFYTYNHYNDFQEYLNYYGGWGEMFGNITGGGTISSKYDYNPTSYVPVALASLRVTRSMTGTETRATILWYDFRHMSECLAWDKARFAA